MKRERRLAVILHLQGHSVREAARLLDWAFKRTENLVYRGLADLRACLQSKGMTP
jgi:RNA polymerase sigma-70 factor (ECF subfamily)